MKTIVVSFTMIVTAIVTTTLLVGSIAQATQPLPSQVQVISEFAKGRVMLSLKNYEQFPVVIEFHPGELSSLKFTQVRIQLRPGEMNLLNIPVEMPNGRQVFHAESSVSGKPGLLQGPAIYEALNVQDRAVRRMTYDEAFLSLRTKIDGQSKPSEIDLGGFVERAPINPLAFKAGAVPSGSRIQVLEYRSPRDYAKMNLFQLPKVSTPINGKPVGDNHRDDLEEENPSYITATPVGESTSANPLTDSLLTVRGNMSLKTDATTFKAAWGWVVRAWQQQSGVWKYLGWSYVGGDGAWAISFDSTQVIPGVQVWVEYRTKNRFVSVQDPSGNPYTWGDNWTLTGALTDVGYRYADLTVNGNLPGMDKLYVGATDVWVKFFNNGMNALRDTPIQVTFPNSLASGQCIYNNASGPYAWSCSYWNDGRIYIIPAHASPSVVQHEIGHSINSYYWNGNMPAGTGGSHSLSNCYNNGLALTEGFANFLTYWVQFDRNNSNPVAPYFNMNIEAVPAGVCAGQTNEMRVASTFWDMYDYWNDGTDTTTRFDSFLYTDQATPVALYLNNKENSMAEYLPVTQSGQSIYWQGEFSKLFRLNTIIP